LKIMIPAIGGILALSAALAAACFVKAFGITFLGRARSDAAAQAVEVDRYARAAMGAMAGLCLLAGLFSGFLIDMLAPVTQMLAGARMPGQGGLEWLSIVPIAEGRSAYNALLLFVFIGASAMITAWIVHRFASRALRRAPAWGCGFSDPAPLGQYSAGSFAQPIRRVFGATVFLARDEVDMPAPGDIRAARYRLVLRDPIWDGLYAPVGHAVSVVATRLNRLQFLTIRLYLSLVFLALVALLTVLAIWQ
jgi:hydrogenase-4 component B